MSGRITLPPHRSRVRRFRAVRTPVRLRYLLGLAAALLAFGLGRSQLPPTGGSSPAPLPQQGIGAVPAPPESVVREYRVRKGDTLLGILRGLGVPEPSIIALANASPGGVNPERLVVGQPYRVTLEQEAVTEYQYEPNDFSILSVRFDGGAPAATVLPIPFAVSTATVGQSVTESLFAAVEAAGEGPALALALADIFAWQIDFFRDIRPGDSFRVVVDKVYRDGVFVRYGDVRAAEFVNDGRRHRAFLYSAGGKAADYFDEEGGSLRKQFLKAPLRFRRISSGFSSRRLHPVTRLVSPHLGVDYAAPVGTPVMATGDGRLVLKRTDEVNGRLLKIRHNGTYSTAYAHLNAFAAGLSVGSDVRQGQIIGYVGSSGRATGPHLHFAMYQNGRYIDPGRVSLPRASEVPKADREAFLDLAGRMTAALEGNPAQGPEVGRALP